MSIRTVVVRPAYRTHHIGQAPGLSATSTCPPSTTAGGKRTNRRENLRSSVVGFGRDKVDSGTKEAVI